jgi:threonine aldolase
MTRIIDLSSDTATRPCNGMREAMVNAAVGDDQKCEDPTVNELQARAADLLGVEASLFLPSATMANQIAIKVHTNPGDEAIVERTSHIVTSEVGGPAFLSGIMLHTVQGRRGMFTPDQLEAGVREKDPHCAPTRLVCVEQTSNRGGGSVWPVDLLHDIAASAHAHELAVHMDGSRLMNAVVASQIDATQHTAGYDSVTLCLSKGLGCPVGALLAGSRPVIESARRYKHLFGGAMRQAGIIAAAGVYALEHNVNRLAEDHANAIFLAEELAGMPGMEIDPGLVETNLVYFDVTQSGYSAKEFVATLLGRGVRMGAPAGQCYVRAVTHLDVTRADIEEAVHHIGAILLAPAADSPSLSIKDPPE